MTRIEKLATWLYFGPFRRAFRKAFRGYIGRNATIRLGPLRGHRFPVNDFPCRLGIYELHVQNALVACLAPGMTVYDIGANVGFHSLLAAKCVGVRGHVYAFEPLAENAEKLRELIGANQVSNLTLIESAVADHVGQAQFFSGQSHAKASLADSSGGRSVHVATTTLDAFVCQHPAPQFILMDIEGFEATVLRASSALVNSSVPPMWLIEVHSEDSHHQCDSLLRSANYHTELLLPRIPRAGVFPVHLLAKKQSAATEGS